MKRIGSIAILALFLLGSASAFAQQPLPAVEEGEWISVTGTVASTGANDFMLDMGDDQIKVRMDEYGWFEDTSLVLGDRVTVTGAMDENFYNRVIVATSIYIDKENTYYFAGGEDEKNGYYAFQAAQYEPDGEWVAMSGKLVSVGEDKLVLDTGSRTIDVDLRDIEALPDLAAGDRVSVSGDMDDADLFDNTRIVAGSVIRLSGGAESE